MEREIQGGIIAWQEKDWIYMKEWIHLTEKKNVQNAVTVHSKVIN